MQDSSSVCIAGPEAWSCASAVSFAILLPAGLVTSKQDRAIVWEPVTLLENLDLETGKRGAAHNILGRLGSVPENWGSPICHFEVTYLSSSITDILQPRRLLRYLAQFVGVRDIFRKPLILEEGIG